VRPRGGQLGDDGVKEPLLCGVDLGGTKLSVGLVRTDGTLVDKVVAYDHTEKNEEGICLQIRDMVHELLEKQRVGAEDIRGVGIGFAGHLRFVEGVVITTSNFPRFKMKNFPIRQMVQSHFSVPVIVDNDASGLALPQLVRKKLEQGTKTQLQVTDSTKINGEFLKQGLESGDPLCRSVVLECADYIGIGIYNLFQIFNPPVIVLGGGWMNWGSLYFERIKKKFYSLAGEMLYDPVEIALARTSRDTGLIGAAALLLEEP